MRRRITFNENQIPLHEKINNLADGVIDLRRVPALQSALIWRYFNRFSLHLNCTHRVSDIAAFSMGLSRIFASLDTNGSVFNDASARLSPLYQRAQEVGRTNILDLYGLQDYRQDRTPESPIVMRKMGR